MKDIAARTKERDFIADISKNRTTIMGLSMIAIMLFHQYFTSVIPFNAFHKFGYWGVEVFLFISGMGLVNSIKENPLRTYYKRRLLRLLPACVLCGSIKYTVFLLSYEKLSILEDGLKLGWWSIFSLDLWFIHTIIILYLFAPFIYHLLHWNSCFTFTITIITVCIINYLFREQVGFNWQNPLGIFVWTLERTPVFMIGMLIGSKSNLYKSSHFYISGLFLFIALVLLLYNTSFIFLYNIISPIVIAFGTPALIKFNIELINHLKPIFQLPLKFTGVHSLELYLVHEFIFWSLIITLSSTSSSFVLLFIAIIISYLTAYLCKIITTNIQNRIVSF